MCFHGDIVALNGAAETALGRQSQLVLGKNWNLTLIRLNLIGHLGSLYIFGGLSKISQIGGLNDQVTTGVMLS